ncbi:MAG: sigma-70 family RNA polymerase sigma factor [Planctomycetia bacterium]|nr:sigma-70 family RNA polymerase sigma factor [Planctomycetia bacterium]
MPILRSLFVTVGSDTASDSELLRRFAETNDRTAFELVVRRHAELVWGVCRAALPRDLHAAEDAFQATFLILARKAATIRDGSAAGWLFRVARNVAVRARSAHVLQPLVDTLPAKGNSVEEEAARREIAPIVSEEVDRLAATLRDPVVLCFLEGHTHAEAAARRGWPVGTVASRLARAKNILRDRLSRRGVAFPAAGLVAVFASPPAPAATLIRAALVIATGPADQVPAPVLSLTKGVLSAMRFAKLKLISALVVVAVGLSVALAAVSGSGTQPITNTQDDSSLPADPPKKPADGKPEMDKRLKALQGKWRVVKSEGGGQEASADQLAKQPPIVIEKDTLINDDGVSDTPLTLAIKFPADGKQAIDLVITGGPVVAFGTTMPGLYKLEDDILTLCIRDMEHLDKGRPTEFKPDKTTAVMILERVKDKKEELKALAGEWTVTVVNFSGKDDPAGQVGKTKWAIEGAKVTMIEPNALSPIMGLKLDPSAVPPTLDLMTTDGKEVKQKGIYFRQGDKLTLCFADPKVKDAARPTELKPVEGVVYIVLERKPKK